MVESHREINCERIGALLCSLCKMSFHRTDSKKLTDSIAVSTERGGPDFFVAMPLNSSLQD